MNTHSSLTTAAILLATSPSTHPIQTIRSRDNRLNTQLDGYTRAVVSYLQQHCRVRVMKLTVEFILDGGTPRLCWARDIETVSGAAASDLRLVDGLPNEGR